MNYASNLSPQKNARPISNGVNLKNFVVPTRHRRSAFDLKEARVVAIIPTYKPERLTTKLALDLTQWNPDIRVVVVDDCTPVDYTEGAAIFARIRSVRDRITVLRTPVNRMKAGALNYALEHIFALGDEDMPDVILSLDDDIVIERETVRNLVTTLMSDERLGAACSQSRVLNKNKNLLTRLQGLEYVGFNATRLADEGFYRGPLVMHGMLTAFRVSALREVGRFAEGHLIEDYEITTRLKTRGWSVKLAGSSPAWTMVPETFSKLWRQRTRWSYGGITVITKVTYLPSVLQDLIGHGVFFVTVIMIGLMLVFRSTSTVPTHITDWIVGLSLLQLALWYAFQLWLMGLYRERDRYDWIIRVSLLPEFIYTNILTFIVLGSYLFLLFNMLTHAVTRQSGSVVRRLTALGAALFAVCGYTKGWGTRTN